MATNPNKVTVRTTPGRNAPVDHVLRLEDLLQRMQQAVPKPARGRAAAPAQRAAELSATRQLAAELEGRLREWRAAAADGPPKKG